MIDFGEVPIKVAGQEKPIRVPKEPRREIPKEVFRDNSEAKQKPFFEIENITPKLAAEGAVGVYEDLIAPPKPEGEK